MGQIATFLAAQAAKMNLQNPIDAVSGAVKLTKKIEIQPFETLYVTGLCTVPVTTKGLNVMIEAGEEPFNDSVTTVNSYLHIKQGTNQGH